jgi:hypothetical protein
MSRKVWGILVGWLVLVSVLVACGQREVVKEVEVTRIVEQEVVQTVEVTRVVEQPAAGEMSLATLAQQIRSGNIDVGDEFGMGSGQRFHRIHELAGLDCADCHVDEAPLEVAQPSNSDSEVAGPVDRRTCLGCHLTGPSEKLYEPKE